MDVDTLIDIEIMRFFYIAYYDFEQALWDEFLAQVREEREYQIGGYY